MPPRKRSPEDSGRGRKQKRDVAPEAKQPSKKRDVSPEDKPKKRGKKQKIQVGGLRRAGRAMSAERTPREQRQRQRDMSVSPVSVSNFLTADMMSDRVDSVRESLRPCFIYESIYPFSELRVFIKASICAEFPLKRNGVDSKPP